MAKMIGSSLLFFYFLYGVKDFPGLGGRLGYVLRFGNAHTLLTCIKVAGLAATKARKIEKIEKAHLSAKEFLRLYQGLLLPNSTAPIRLSLSE